MNLKLNRIFVAAGYSMAFILLSLPFLGIGSEILAQGTNTTTSTNTTNATAASAGEVSPITVVMPAGSAAAVGGGGYEPDSVTVSPGSTIVWDNQDDALHTATSGNPETAVLDDMFDTGYVMANQQSNPIPMPTEPGEYTYFCTLHPFLTGTVIVQ
jgi:cytochrome c oxidase subunit 2